MKGAADWDSDPAPELLVKVADLLQASLVDGDGPVPRLSSSVDAILVRPTRDSAYVVYNGFAYNANGQLIFNNPVSLNSHFANNGKYVDAVNRITKMNNPDRSGDIILILKYDTDIPTEEKIEDHRYTSGVSCKSWHGSLNPSDSYVPFIFAYPGGNTAEIEQILKADTLCKQDYSECKGNWKLTDIVKKIIETQYSGQ